KGDEGLRLAVANSACGAVPRHNLFPPAQPPLPAPALTAVERTRLLRACGALNARDFDGVRDMLADDVRLDLVNWLQRQGPQRSGRILALRPERGLARHRRSCRQPAGTARVPAC